MSGAAAPSTLVSSKACPASVLASTILAKTLTVSDQHATILLTTKPMKSGDSDETVARSAILKLTLVPFHKTELATVSHTEQLDSATSEERTRQAELLEKKEKEHSRKVLNFLSRYDWRMTSESGAEYSFHEAFLKPSSKRGIPECAEEAEPPVAKRDKTEEETNPAANAFKGELIFPASERQVSRAMPSPGSSMIYETPSVYETVTKPFIDGIVASGSLSWLKNIVEIKKEKERLLLDADGWILNVDTKWRTHPDALTVPRSLWYKHESIADLYCLAILKAGGVASVRDLTAGHLPILRDILDRGPKVIEEIYGVKSDQLRIFVHYQPQFYHFHVHFTRLQNETGTQVEKAHLLTNIIQDLEKDGEYFKTRAITYKLSLKDKLYKLIAAHNADTADATKGSRNS